MKSTKSRKTTRFTVDQTVATTVATRIVSLLNRRNTGSWEGTMSALNAAITNGRNPIQSWPGSPSVLRRVVNHIRPMLNRAGIRINFTRTSDHMRTRLVSFTHR
jgi:hypothetical protein